MCIQNRHDRRPIIQWFLVLSCWLCLFCSTSTTNDYILRISQGDFKHALCPILSNYKDGTISSRNQASNTTSVFLFYRLCLESTWSLKSHLTHYYQTLAELICQFLGRLDEFIFYFTICNLINQLQFLQRYLIFSTAPLDAIVCMEDSSLCWTVLYSYSYVSRVTRFSLKFPWYYSTNPLFTLTSRYGWPNTLLTLAW